VSAWHAGLSLAIERRGERSVLSRRVHHGPLLVQKSLYPEGDAVCHAVLLHPPGGVAGGDRLDIRIEIGVGARALMTTPGATRWYKRGVSGTSRQRFSARVAADAALEWLPQENIVFDSADAVIETRLELEGNARAIGWEIVCLGRAASGERARRCRLLQRTEVWRDEKLVFRECGEIRPDDPLRTSPVGLDGKRVFGTLWLAGETRGRALSEALRALALDGVACGVTALPCVTLVRALSDCGEDLRRAFIRCWKTARPVFLGRAAVEPRIWAV
jgi:urease accessory protein